MALKGIKICKACRKAFEPQLTDAEIRELWFTEEQLVAEEEHVEMSGHGHLMAPYQELCGKCAMDPEVEVVGGGFFGGPARYMKRKPKSDGGLRKLKVTDSNIVSLPKQEGVHDVETSDGFKMRVEGPLPPQEIIDAMGTAVREGGVEGTIKPIKIPHITISKKKKKPWWQFWK